MRAVMLTGYGDNKKLELVELSRPQAAAGEVLIQVHYAGVNPVDFKIRNGMLRLVTPYQLPQPMGNEVAGTVAAVGEGVTDFKQGDAVFTRLAKERMGGFADFVACDASLVAHKPGTYR